MSQYHKKFLRKMLAVSDPLTGETFIPKAKRNQSELIKHALFINTWNTKIYYQTDNAWSWIWTSSLEPTISYINEGSKMKLVSLQSVTHTHTHTHTWIKNSSLNDGAETDCITNKTKSLQSDWKKIQTKNWSVASTLLLLWCRSTGSTNGTELGPQYYTQ